MSSDARFSKSRIEYQKDSLDIDSTALNPFIQFDNWYSEAINSEPFEANACALATVGQDLQPSVRMVLLKALDEHGFVFFSNYNSRKGRDLEGNNRAALVFYWGSLERQVRIEGLVEPTSDAESERYFNSRPRESQLGSAISKQSEVAPSRKALDDAIEQLRTDIGEREIVRPKHWGGYRLVPRMIEFWQGRENRLHDRIRYLLTKDSLWIRDRLWP
jgi:pyridoxamine 5'-phosphate oxidase